MVIFSVVHVNILGQQSNSVSFISTDVSFLGSRVISSNSRQVPHSNISLKVVTNYKYNYYRLRFSILINKKINSPLEVKIIPQEGAEQIYRIEDIPEVLEKDKIYDYDFVISSNSIGWARIEIGDFSTPLNEHQNTNKIYDATNIYFSK